MANSFGHRPPPVADPPTPGGASQPWCRPPLALRSEGLDGLDETDRRLVGHPEERCHGRLVVHIVQGPGGSVVNHRLVLQVEEAGSDIHPDSRPGSRG